MFGLGTWEILIILVVALIFIGPDKLPGVAKQIGKGFRQVKNAMDDVDAEVRREQREVYDTAREATDSVKDAEPKKILRDVDASGPGEAPMTDAPTVAEPDESGAPEATAAAGAPPTDAPPAPPAERADADADAGAAPHTARDWAAHAKKPVAGRVAAPPPTSVAERLKGLGPPSSTPAPAAPTDAAAPEEGRDPT